VPKRQEDELTRQAQLGIDLQDEFTDHIKDVTGEGEVSVDTLTELYLKSDFDERTLMFIEIFASRGADGLEVLGEVFNQATERLSGEVG
jgi:hypothetical protein